MCAQTGTGYRDKGKMVGRGYAAREQDCKACALKPQCTLAQRRIVKRHRYQAALERMQARATADAIAPLNRRASLRLSEVAHLRLSALLATWREGRAYGNHAGKHCL